MKYITLSLCLIAFTFPTLSKADTFQVPRKPDPGNPGKFYHQPEDLKRIQDLISPIKLLEWDHPATGGSYKEIYFRGEVKSVIPGNMNLPYSDPEYSPQMVVRVYGTGGQSDKEVVVNYRYVKLFIETDNLFDLHRKVGNLNEIYKVEMNNPIYETLLYKHIDPTGELGLSKASGTGKFPPEFKHGWLTYFIINGPLKIPDDFHIITKDPLNPILFPMSPGSMGFGHDGLILVEALARENLYHLQKNPLYKESILKLAKIYCDFHKVNPDLVPSDLSTKARRIKEQLAVPFLEMVVMSLQPSWPDQFKRSDREFTLNNDAKIAAALEIITRNEVFRRSDISQGIILQNLIRAAVAGEERFVYQPTPENIANAAEMIKSLLENNKRSAQERKDRLFFRNKAYGYLDPHGKFEGPHKLITEVLYKVGWGTLQEVKMVVDQQVIWGTQLARNIYDAQKDGKPYDVEEKKLLRTIKVLRSIASLPDSDSNNAKKELVSTRISNIQKDLDKGYGSAGDKKFIEYWGK